ncbi:MAG: transporter [Aquabacterium sp.]|uniref:SphA family protein n=1 Tax=Aquabacterium sp. TaxID=1872578 RepID=UPI0025B8B0BE|nr:transporter [Aquabacterium sp.]MBI5926431.1 transporter [Aquabacterium sp.]
MARHSNRSVSASSFMKVSTLVLALAGASQALAAENGLQRYSPGVGGSDMTTPLVPGWYVQMPMVAYHASKIKGDDGKQATSVVPNPLTGQPLPFRATASAKVDSEALLPRVTYLDTARFLGANVGFTVMLPLVHRKGTFGLVAPAGIGSSLVPSGGGVTWDQALASKAATQNGSEVGIGDLEFSPLLHWEIGDHQAVTLAPTIVLPTGDYNVAQRVNPGFGNFVTFRPSVQYAFIGDGWDVGVRGVLSFNTRNKDNGYYSGNMFNLDWQLMKFVSDDVRVGLQGYFVRQFTKDTQDLTGLSPTLAKEIINGNKASVNAAGPAIGWLKNGGEMLLEGKFLKEFDARNRTEGQAFWLTVSKPL